LLSRWLGLDLNLIRGLAWWRSLFWCTLLLGFDCALKTLTLIKLFLIQFTVFKFLYNLLPTMPIWHLKILSTLQSLSYFKTMMPFLLWAHQRDCVSRPVNWLCWSRKVWLFLNCFSYFFRGNSFKSKLLCLSKWMWNLWIPASIWLASKSWPLCRKRSFNFKTFMLLLNQIYGVKTK
jgi:hypothetical protein